MQQIGRPQRPPHQPAQTFPQAVEAGKPVPVAGRENLHRAAPSFLKRTAQGYTILTRPARPFRGRHKENATRRLEPHALRDPHAVTRHHDRRVAGFAVVGPPPQFPCPLVRFGRRLRVNPYPLEAGADRLRRPPPHRRHVARFSRQGMPARVRSTLATVQSKHGPNLRVIRTIRAPPEMSAGARAETDATETTAPRQPGGPVPPRFSRDYSRNY